MINKSEYGNEDRTKQLILDILNDKKIGVVIGINEDCLALGGKILGEPKNWTVACMAGFQLMKDILDHKISSDDEIVIELCRKFMDNNQVQVENPNIRKIADNLAKKLSKAINKNPEKIEEILEKFTEELGGNATIVKINKAGILENLPSILEGVELATKLSDEWIAKNNGSNDIPAFFEKHGRIFHNTPDGAVFPCGKAYTVDDGANASEHMENCKYCSDLLTNLEKLKEIKEQRGK